MFNTVPQNNNNPIFSNYNVIPGDFNENMDEFIKADNDIYIEEQKKKVKAEIVNKNINADALNNISDMPDFLKEEYDYVYEKPQWQKELEANVATQDDIEEWEKQGPIGIGRVAKDWKKWYFAAPYLGTSSETTLIVRNANTLRRLKNGEEVSEVDKELLYDFLREEKEKEVRGISYGGRALDGLRTGFGYTVEFGLGLMAAGSSGGIGFTAVAKTLADIGAKRAARKAVKAALKEAAIKSAAPATTKKTVSHSAAKKIYEDTLAKTTGAKALANVTAKEAVKETAKALPKAVATSAVFGTTAMLPHEINDVASNQIATGIYITDYGDAVLTDSENLALSIMKAFGNSTFDVLTETVGWSFSPVANYFAKPIQKIMPKKFFTGFEKLVSSRYGMPAAKVLRKYGYDGVIEEMGEELLNRFLCQTFGLNGLDEYDFDGFMNNVFYANDLSQWGVEALSFGATSMLAHGAVGAGSTVSDKWNKRKTEKNIKLLTDRANKYIQSPEQFYLDQGLIKIKGSQSLAEQKLRDIWTSQNIEQSVQDDVLKNMSETEIRAELKKNIEENLQDETPEVAAKRIEKDLTKKFIENKTFSDEKKAKTVAALFSAPLQKLSKVIGLSLEETIETEMPTIQREAQEAAKENGRYIHTDGRIEEIFKKLNSLPDDFNDEQYLTQLTDEVDILSKIRDGALTEEDFEKAKILIENLDKAEYTELANELKELSYNQIGQYFQRAAAEGGNGNDEFSLSQFNAQKNDINQRTDKTKYLTDNEVEQLEKDKENFETYVNKLIKGELSPLTQIRVLEKLTSAYNNIPSLKGKKVVITQDVYKKIIDLPNRFKKNHYVDRKRAIKLPQLIADPLYILKSTSEGNEHRFVVVTSSKNNIPAQRLSIFLNPNNSVAIVSGYYEEINISEEKKAGRVLYDKKKELLKTLSASKAVTMNNSNTTITNFANNFNPNVDNHEENPNIYYQSAISKKTSQKAREVLNALQKIANGSEEETVKDLRNDLEQYGGTNDVTFIFGNNKKGIQHIAQKHGAKTLLKVFDTVIDGNVIRYSDKKKTVIIGKDNYEAVLSLDENGNKKTWLLSGWDVTKPKEKSSDVNSEVSTQSVTTQIKPTFSRQDLGAELNNIITDDARNLNPNVNNHEESPNVYYQSKNKNSALDYDYITNQITGAKIKIEMNEDIKVDKIEPQKISSELPFKVSQKTGENRRQIINNLGLIKGHKIYVANNNTNEKAYISRDTIKKSISNINKNFDYKDFIEIIYDIENLFKTSQKILSYKDAKQNTDTIIKRYANIAKGNKADYLLEFTLKDNGEIELYGVNIINNEAVSKNTYPKMGSALETANYSIANIKDIFKSKLVEKYNNDYKNSQLRKILEGQVIYDLSSVRPQENLARSSSITNFQGDFNPNVNNHEENPNIYYQNAATNYQEQFENIKANLNYKQFVNKVFDNKLSKQEKSKPFQIGKTPDKLIQAGFPDNNISIGYKIIEKTQDNRNPDHNLSKETIREVYQALDNPIAVIKAEQNKNEKTLNNRYSVVVDLKDDAEKYVLVAFEINKKDGNILLNDIRSIHSRKDYTPLIDKAFNENRLIKIDRDKIKDLLTPKIQPDIISGGVASLIENIYQQKNDVKFFQSPYKSLASNYSYIHNQVTGEKINIEMNEDIKVDKIEPQKISSELPFVISQKPSDNKKSLIKSLGLSNGKFINAVNNNTGETAKINNKTIEKSLSNISVKSAYYNDFCNIVLNVETLFKTSQKILNHRDTKTDSDININRYANIAKINENDYLLEFVLKDNGEVKLYSVDIINNKKQYRENASSKNSMQHDTAISSITNIKDIFKSKLIKKSSRPGYDKIATVYASEKNSSAPREDIYSIANIKDIFKSKLVEKYNNDYKKLDSIKYNQSDDAAQANLFFDNITPLKLRNMNIKGAFVPAENLIELFKNADESTIIHEFAHWWLSRLEKYAANNDELALDLEEVRKFVKNNGEKFTREQHEKFAVGFEAYIRNGSARSNRLKRIFEDFKNALIQIYDSIRQLVYTEGGEQYSFTEDDVKNLENLFERLLTTENERIKKTVFDRCDDINNKIKEIKSRQEQEMKELDEIWKDNIAINNRKSDKKRKVQEYLDMAETSVRRVPKEVKEMKKRYKNATLDILSIATGMDKRAIANPRNWEKVQMAISNADDKITIQGGMHAEWEEFYTDTGVNYDTDEVGGDYELAEKAFNVLVDGNYNFGNMNEDEIGNFYGKFEYLYNKVQTLKGEEKSNALQALWSLFENIPSMPDEVVKDIAEKLGKIGDDYEEGQKEDFNRKTYPNIPVVQQLQYYVTHKLSDLKVYDPNVRYKVRISKSHSLYKAIKNATSVNSTKRIIRKINEYVIADLENQAKAILHKEIQRQIRVNSKLVKVGTISKGKFDWKTNTVFAELAQLNKLKQDEAFKEYAAMIELDKAAIGEERENNDENVIPAPEFKTDFQSNLRRKFLEYRSNKIKDLNLLATRSLLEDIMTLKFEGRRAKDAEELEKRLQKDDMKTDLAQRVRSIKDNNAAKAVAKFIMGETPLTSEKTLVNWETALNALFGRDVAQRYSLLKLESDAEVYAYKHYSDFCQKAIELYGLNNPVNAKEKFLDKFNRFVDFGNVQPLIKLMQEYEEEYCDLVETTFSKETGQFVKTPCQLSRAEIITLYAWSMNEELEQRIMTQYGYSQVRYMFDEILSDEDKQFAWLLIDTCEEMYDENNEVFIRTTGLSLPKVTNYFPSKTVRVGSEIDMLHENVVRSSNPSFIKQRKVCNRIKMKPEQPISILLPHINKTARYVILSERLNYLNAIFKDSTVRAAIKEVFDGVSMPLANIVKRGKGKKNKQKRTVGDRIHDTLINQLGSSTFENFVRVLNVGKVWTDTLATNYITSRIGGNLKVAFGQLTSVINYAEKMPAGLWGKGFAEGLKTPKETFKYMLDNCDYLKARLAGNSMNEIMSRITDESDRFRTLRNFCSTNTKYGDILAICFGGKPYVDYLIKQGMTKEQAFEKFVEDTLRAQQSGHNSATSVWQKKMSENFFTRMMFAFNNTSLQYERKFLDAVAQRARGETTDKEFIKALIIYKVFNPILFTSFLGNLSIMQLIGSLIRGDGDDDTLARFGIDAASAVVFANMGAYGFAGMGIKTIFQFLMATLDKKEYKPFLSAVPIISDIEGIGKDLILKNEVTVADWVEAMAVVGDDATGVPVSRITNAAGGIGDIAQGEFGVGTLRLLGWGDYRAHLAATGEPPKKRK